MVSFLEDVRAANGRMPILIVVDDARVHTAKVKGGRRPLRLPSFPPAYLPDLQPIEFGWNDRGGSWRRSYFESTIDASGPPALKLFEEEETCAAHRVESFIMGRS
jgi:transposase